MPHPPYIETESVDLQPEPTGNGIDMSSFEKYAQGVSITNPIKKGTSLIPSLTTGTPGSVLEMYNIVPTERFDSQKPFEDRLQFNAVSYIENNSPEVYIGDYLPIDGAIEPLTIRDEASFDSIEFPISHKIRGALMDGNTDFFGTTDQKLSHYRFEDVQETDFYIDSDKSELLISDMEEKTFPFDDTDFGSSFLTNDAGINSVLLENNDGRRIQNNALLESEKSATSGFVYSNKEGTDSIAFGGLQYE